MGWFSQLKSLFIKKKDETRKGSAMSLGRDFSGRVDYHAEFNATYHNCATALARHASKMRVEPCNDRFEMRNFKYLSKLLQYQPNPVQTAGNFWYSMAYEYFFGGISFAYIDWDYYSDISTSRIKAIWAIAPSEITQIKLLNDEVYIQFNLSGVTKADTLDHFIVLVRDPHAANPYNNYDPSIKKTLEILAENEEGIIKAIKTSNIIRFIVSSPSNLSDATLRRNQEELEDRLEQSKSVLYVSGVENVTQVNNQVKWVSSDDMKEIKKEIYNYFGVNEEFLSSSYDEDRYRSVYQGAIEPFANMLAQELTCKIFSAREFDLGSRIRVVTNPLESASMETRIKVAETYIKSPIITSNVVNDILGLPRSENGDKEVQSLNYVSAEQADRYQVETDGGTVGQTGATVKQEALTENNGIAENGEDGSDGKSGQKEEDSDEEPGAEGTALEKGDTDGEDDPEENESKNKKEKSK